jgi:hypothetical protein
VSFSTCYIFSGQPRPINSAGLLALFPLSCNQLKKKLIFIDGGVTMFAGQLSPNAFSEFSLNMLYV